MAEPPELSRLKCAGHHHKGNTGSNALQTEQFLVCRVTSRYNHRFSDRTSILRTKASPELLQPYIFYNTGIVVITTCFKVLITDPNLVKHYTRHKFKVQSWKAAERKHDGYNTSQKGTKLAQARYHSSGSLPVEDGSHSTDQPGGKEQGQDRLANLSLKLKPEKGFNSKVEYYNTQQDLTVNGYT